MTPYKKLMLSICLTAMWSPSFLFIKLAVEELPPFTVVAARVSIAAMCFIAVLLFLRRSLPTSGKFWMHSIMMALFSSVCPFCLFCYAEQSIESALAGILNGCSPMFTALLAQIFVASDRISVKKAIGISFSFVGLVCLFAPNIANGMSGTSIGMLAATTATFCYALSHVYAKLFVTGQKPFIAPAAQLIASSVILIPIAFYYDSPWTLPMPSLYAIGGVLGMALLGTFTAFIIYYYLIEHSGPTAISMIACFFPAGAMLLGFVFLGERMTIGSLAASGLILLGLMTVNDVIRIPFLSREEEATRTA